MKEIYFINGMPRSGSTLLCNILAQNPDFHVTPTSGLADLISVTHQFWRNSPVIKASENSDKQLRIIKDMFQSFHYDTDRPIVFNKSRSWANMIELVENVTQIPVKILTTTRKMTGILASLEKLYRKELKLIDSPFQQNSNTMTLESRINSWTASDGLVGGAYNTILDAFFRGHRDKFHLIQYDELTAHPKTIMQGIYKFLNKPYFNHDFNNVSQYTKENDTEHGFTDLHTIRPVIAPQKDDSKQILGPFHEQYNNFNLEFKY